jgi:hypothetical protein
VLRREFARSVDFIRKYRRNGKLLELGCAYGFFLVEAARHFDVIGIEHISGLRYDQTDPLAAFRASIPP